MSEDDNKAERTAAVGYPGQGIPGADLARIEAEREDRAVAERQQAERVANYREAKGLDKAEEDADVSNEDRVDAIHDDPNLNEGDARDEFIANRQEAMVNAGATDAEIQEAAQSGALLAGGIDSDGDPAPTPGSDADKQTGQFENEEAVPEDEQKTDADKQRAVLDLSAPDDDKRAAAVDAVAESDGRPTHEELEGDSDVENAGDASRAALLAEQAQGDVEVPTDGTAEENDGNDDDSRTVDELKDELRKAGKKVSGTKDELVARLNGDEEE